jgi:hypothetical protein
MMGMLGLNLGNPCRLQEVNTRCIKRYLDPSPRLERGEHSWEKGTARSRRNLKCFVVLIR